MAVRVRTTAGPGMASTGRQAEAAGLGASAAWRFHVVGEIGNFGALRRRLGARRAGLLVHDLGARLMDVVPTARIAPISRSQLEIAWEGETTADLHAGLDAMVAACRSAFELEGAAHHVALVLGGTWAPACADDILMAEAAELALAEARLADRAIVTDMIVAHDSDTDDLARELNRAMANDELALMYQPKAHVRQQEFRSAEALIRWHHPERGLVLPGDFIPAAEQVGLIDRLSLWTIERAIADQRALRERGHDLRIFINISGQLLGDPVFVDAACKLVMDSGAMLGFEVTETSVIRDPASAIANLQRFADIGIRIAIDDYGAGLSSLAYLKQLPATELKIDKQFVTQLSSSHRDPLIVRSTIDLAHALDMEVVAEGVETAATLALLTVMGCDIVQGYFISRPITFDALVLFLNDQERHVSLLDRQPFNRLAGSWKRA
jgi:EAL domain-containing protein (putative c-di-GMP-specific phosphodiesterase class I)